MTEVYFQDTTIRDGAQSLWAYNIRTGMMAPVCDQLDEAGFEAIELGGPIEMPKCVKELREDPWERYRLIIPKFKRTPLRLVHGTRSGFAIYPDACINSSIPAWPMSASAKCASRIRGTTPADWAWRVKQAKHAGLKPIINLIYTVSPRHTDEYYAAKIQRSRSPSMSTGSSSKTPAAS